MKVLLTSGTGYIGSGVARALKAAGHSVLAIARSEEASGKLLSAGVEPIKGDIKDPENIANFCTKCDAVVHTAMVYGSETQQVENVLANHLVSKLSGSETKVIYTSGIWVYGPSGDQAITEEAPLAPTPLVAWRPFVEQIYLKAAKNGLESIVIRPAMVYGGSGGVIGNMLDLARKNRLVRYVGTGTNYWSLIHVEDLGRLYVQALLAGRPGNIYNGSAGAAMTVYDLAVTLAEIVGIPGKVQSWPLQEARSTLGAYADALAMNLIVSSHKAQKELNWQPIEPELSQAYTVVAT